MTDQTTTRHLKRYRIDDRDILEYLRRNDNWPDYLVAAANVKGPPQGCQIHTVYFDYSTQGYWVVVSHPEFPEVPDGEYIPAADGELNAESIHLGRCRDGAYRVIDIDAMWASVIHNDGPVCPTCKRPNDHFIAKEFSLAVSEYVKHLELSEKSVLVARVPVELPPAVARDNLYNDLCKLLVDSCKAIVVLPHDMDLSVMDTSELKSLRDKLNEILYDRENQ